MSVDIDLFTDSPYGQIDFSGLVAWFSHHYAYVDGNLAEPAGLEISLFAGASVESAVKIDPYYTDAFIKMGSGLPFPLSVFREGGRG